MKPMLFFEDKMSILDSVTNSSQHSSSRKDSQPMVDDYDDEEDEHKRNFLWQSKPAKYTSRYRNFGIKIPKSNNFNILVIKSI